MSKHTPGPWRTSPANKGIGDRDMFVMADKPEGQAELAKVYDWAEYGGSLPAEANARLIAAAPELDAYRQYVEDNLERIERGGWTPVCFDEFRDSEECANYMKEES